jgi:hypothetical protein
MDNSRMSTADMLQYCDEALAWEEFGPVDIFFFESVKKILLGQCSAFEEVEPVIDDYMGIERPVTDEELEPEYHKYADEYYYEEGIEESEVIEDMKESDAPFEAKIFEDGFFNAETAAENQMVVNENDENAGFTVKM